MAYEVLLQPRARKSHDTAPHDLIVASSARLVRWRANVVSSAQWNSNGTSKKKSRTLSAATRSASSAPPNGESFGGFTMKHPNLSHLRIDRVATNKIRTALSKKNRVTITVNLDSDSLKALKTLSRNTGIPYQRLMNTVLTTNVTQQESIQSRLHRLEPELRKIKRHVAA